MVELIVDIKPLGIYSAHIKAPFDEGKETLNQAGYDIISLRDNAQLRMQQGTDSFVSKNGNWVREGVLYVRDKGTFLTKKSPIMANPQEATEFHRVDLEFYLTAQQLEEALEDSVKLSRDSIPTNRFAEDPVTVYAFGEVAEQYGAILSDNKLKEMRVWLASPEDKPFARQMWFHKIVGGRRSGLVGDYRHLDGNNRVRGVRQGGEPPQKF